MGGFGLSAVGVVHLGNSKVRLTGSTLKDTAWTLIFWTIAGAMGFAGWYFYTQKQYTLGAIAAGWSFLLFVGRLMFPGGMLGWAFVPFVIIVGSAWIVFVWFTDLRVR